MYTRTPKQLYTRALAATRSYFMIYGRTPEKIGIHYKDIDLFRTRYSWLLFLRPSSPGSMIKKVEDCTLSVPSSQTVMIPFEPIAGESIEYNEVYFPVPGNPLHARSAEVIEQMMQRILENPLAALHHG